MTLIQPERVDEAAVRIQSMPPVPRALLAREALLVGAGQGIAAGPSETHLRRILARTGPAGMGPISLALLMMRLRRVRTGTTTAPESVFLGINALRETELQDRIRSRDGVEPVFVDTRMPQSYALLPRPRWTAVLQKWRGFLTDACAILQCPDPDFAPLDILSTLTMRLHNLAWLCAVFETLKASRPRAHIHCSTADTAAHAAALAGFRPVYHQHGFLGRGLVFPDFSAMVALTAIEGRHVQSRVSGMALNVPVARHDPRPVSRTVAIAGDYLATNPAPVTSFVETVRSEGFDVIVRPHPNGSDTLWSGIRSMNGVSFDTSGRFEDFLETWRPAVVASWFSTTLLDALMAGALPVTFSAGRGGTLIFPFERIASPWPRAADLLCEALRNEDIRGGLCRKFTKTVFFE